ncbi:unknown protein [Seminavis robusta]|uniref:MYND-type domain-containing protein n=1 Tax=Seminavis robusta TaxID=568900 RepID=A0A9N8HHX0_9STRA|nr:unknown protein [Seminavis robusta]|eukprot:Sro738_g195260.1 n/a (192) ;mRNA; f:13724-14299
MDDFFLDALKHPPDLKAKRVCCGCKKEEPANKPFKLQCSRCKDEGFVPALFCAKKCYKQAWPKHKEWHETKERETRDVDAVHQSRLKLSILEDILENQGSSEYYSLVVAGLRKMDSGDFAGAKKQLRKAQKLDTRRPEAFLNLAQCFYASGMQQEFISNIQEVIKRWALVALTGNYTDGRFVDLKGDEMWN